MAGNSGPVSEVCWFYEPPTLVECLLIWGCEVEFVVRLECDCRPIEVVLPLVKVTLGPCKTASAHGEKAMRHQVWMTVHRLA